MKPVRFDWTKMKKIQKIHRLLYAIGFGPLIGRIILLLTTTGRKTGLKRITPLQYEFIDDKYYIGSARGQKADWFQNIQANPGVEVQVKSLHFIGQAEAVTDRCRIADFLEHRLHSHPNMVGMMMKMHGLPSHPTREQLEGLADDLAMVIIQPAKFSEN
jgi:deazaflavin-dependent oxidoreductase (nitroreductase family)